MGQAAAFFWSESHLVGEEAQSEHQPGEPPWGPAGE